MPRGKTCGVSRRLSVSLMLVARQIFYVPEFQSLVRDEGVSVPEALQAAARNRLRPIAMTTIAAILALLPFAFALGQGAAMQPPLAVAIISGLIARMPLVLLGASKTDVPGDK